MQLLFCSRCYESTAFTLLRCSSCIRQPYHLHCTGIRSLLSCCYGFLAGAEIVLQGRRRGGQRGASAPPAFQLKKQEEQSCTLWNAIKSFFGHWWHNHDQIRFMNKQHVVERKSYLYNCVKYIGPAKGWNENVPKRCLCLALSQRGAHASQRTVKTVSWSVEPSITVQKLYRYIVNRVQVMQFEVYLQSS